MKIQKCYRGYVGRREARVLRKTRKDEEQKQKYMRSRKAEAERIKWEAELNEQLKREQIKREKENKFLLEQAQKTALAEIERKKIVEKVKESERIERMSVKNWREMHKEDGSLYYLNTSNQQVSDDPPLYIYIYLFI